MNKDKGASPDGDRAVVNGAGQAVSALRASVPSAVKIAASVVVVWTAFVWGHNTGYREGGAQMRDAIMCVGLASIGDVDASNRRYCNKLGVDFSRGQAQAIEARRAETAHAGSVVDESAVRDSECAPTPAPTPEGQSS